MICVDLLDQLADIQGTFDRDASGLLLNLMLSKDLHVGGDIERILMMIKLYPVIDWMTGTYAIDHGAAFYTIGLNILTTVNELSESSRNVLSTKLNGRLVDKVLEYLFTRLLTVLNRFSTLSELLETMLALP